MHSASAPNRTEPHSHGSTPHPLRAQVIRIAIISSGFLAITRALIVVQPTSRLRAPGPDMAGGAMDVTRANTGANTVANTEANTGMNAPRTAQSDPLRASPSAAPTTPGPAPMPEAVAAPEPAAPAAAAQAITDVPALETGLDHIMISALQQGQTRFSSEIFNANRDQLGTMAQLKGGQKLVMPAL